MSNRVQSKYKINRRLGVNLWGRPKSPYNKREYGPGQHGQRRRKPSDFGTQLAAKQKLKGYYGNIGEKQFRRYYQEAVRRRGDTGENLIELLERRLDAVVYRAKFVPTVFAARQFVNHGHILVNGKRVNIPSYQVQPEDVVTVNEKARKQIRIQSALDLAQQRGFADWIDVDIKKMEGVYKSRPERSELPPDINEHPVVELYSK